MYEEKTEQIDPVIYSHRKSATDFKRTYTVEEDNLSWKDEVGRCGQLFFSDIVNVEGQFSPSRFQSNRYIVRIECKDSNTLAITNTNYISFGDFEDRSNTYVPLIRMLHEKILRHNPGVNFLKGTSWGGYIFANMMVIFTIVIVAVAGAFFVLFGLFWVTLIKLVLLIYYFPSLIRYVKRNKPGEYDPLNLPNDILPSITN